MSGAGAVGDGDSGGYGGGVGLLYWNWCMVLFLSNNTMETSIQLGWPHSGCLIFYNGIFYKIWNGLA